MKFGKLLQENKVKGWEKYYVEYKALKKLIKVCNLYPTKEDIGYFQLRIAQDIQKITRFYEGQVKLYRAQFNHLKKIAERQNISSRQASPTEWVDYQITSRRLIDNLRALKDYGVINSEGLRKIVKKYDKRCKPEAERMTEAFVLELNQQSFHRQDDLQKLANEVTLFILRLPVKGDPIRLSAKSSQALSKLRIVRDLLDEAITADKEVVIPIAVEPRTYMANERTFLKWLRVAFTALTAGVALIEFMGHN
jgi:SPX domain protein involved in polyphosphate accumulation